MLSYYVLIVVIALMFLILSAGILQNATIEERVALLEIQVVELEEDFTELEGDVNFLFAEQVIQDERLFSLEQGTDVIDDELDAIDDEFDIINNELQG